MNNLDPIWLLISKKLTGEATEAELEELQRLARSNPELQQFLEITTALWRSGVQTNKAEAEQAFQRHMNRMGEIAIQQQEDKKAIWENRSQQRQSHYYHLNFGILKNYFKVIYRNLYRFKSFTIINITGLAIGMASAILILLLVAE